LHVFSPKRPLLGGYFEALRYIRDYVNTKSNGIYRREGACILLSNEIPANKYLAHIHLARYNKHLISNSQKCGARREDLASLASLQFIFIHRPHNNYIWCHNKETIMHSNKAPLPVSLGLSRPLRLWSLSRAFRAGPELLSPARPCRSSEGMVPMVVLGLVYV
jgi:hypothetical protein